MNQQNNKSDQKIFWVIVVTIIITSILVGGGVYLWQKSAANRLQRQLQSDITRQQQQIRDLQQIQSESEYKSNLTQSKIDHLEKQIKDLQQMKLKLIRKNRQELDNIAPILENKLSNWIRLWQKLIPGFDFDSLIKQEVKTIGDLVYPYNPVDTIKKLRKQLYIFSPDRNKFLDIYGGMLLWEKDGKIRAGFDVDHQVMMGDLKENQLKRLLSCGTCGGYHDALWIDNNTFIVTGFMEYFPKSDEEKLILKNKFYYVTTLYIFNLSENTMTEYNSPKVDETLFRKIYFPAWRKNLKNKFPNILFD